ncbi:MAG: YraN family protein [Frankiales bacterium]|nr:YraN family protein [Frankiales bacterium]
MDGKVDGMRSKGDTGRAGERLAAKYLLDAGYVLLDTNWRCDRGEIDIVAQHGSILVFCEVKTRSSNAFGEPIEAVTAQKSGRLRLLAVYWLARQTRNWLEMRFDVIGVLWRPGQTAQIRHVEGAF